MKKIMVFAIVSALMCGNTMVAHATDSESSKSYEEIITEIAEESGISRETVKQDVNETAEIMGTDVDSAASYLLNEVKNNKVPETKNSRSSTYLGNSVPGDIFYTDSSTAGWNHGHTAIYLTYNRVVEAAKIGYASRMVYTDKYVVSSGANAQILMVVDKDFGTTRSAYSVSAGKNAAQYAGKGYNPSLINKSCSGDMNCSQIVWCAWKPYVDIDSTPGDSTVLPLNIVNSYRTKKVRTVI